MLTKEAARQKPKPGVDEGSLGRRLFSNYVFQLLNQLIRIGEQLLLVPLFLSAWGPEVYKDWILLYAIIVFLLMCNFGTEYYFGNLFLKFIASGDEASFQRQFRIALFCTLAISAVLLLLAVLVAFFVDVTKILTFAGMDKATVKTCLVLMVVPVSVRISEQMLHTIYRAFGEFSRGECIYAVYYGTQLCSVAAALLLRQPPTVVALTYLIVPLAFSAFQLIDLLRRYPSLSFGIALPTRAELRSIATQSSLYFTYPLSLALVQNATLIMFGLLEVGATAVVTYTVLRTFTGLTRQVANQYAVGGGIEMARQAARGDYQTCRQLYGDIGRVVTLLVGVLGGFTVVVSGPFVALWTHGTVTDNHDVLLCFLAGIFFAAPGQAALMLLNYGHMPRPCAVAWVGQSVGGLLIASALVPPFGIAGAAFGFAIAETLAIGLYTPLVVQSAFGFSAARHVLVHYGIGAAAFAGSYGVALLAFAMGSVGGSTVATIVLSSALWGVVVGPPTLLLVLSQRRRAELLARVRRALAGAVAVAARLY